MVDTNILYYGDNLHILRDYIPDESIHLIYLDPPFNSQATYNILFRDPGTGKLSQAQSKTFEDTWHWTQETERAFQELVQVAPSRVVEMIRAFRSFLGVNDMMAYLTMMCLRILELKRVLRKDGSIYLHCDPTASHYLKVMMDTIFGAKNFRREIAWRSGWVSGFKTRTTNWVRNHDILFYYIKGNKAIFNKIFVPHPPGYKRRGGGENPQGVPMDDVWTDIYSPWIMSFSNEKLGYRTQKPIALLERIIQASSNPGDVILDPFCGCGTALVAAHGLDRQWIGIDITHLAISTMKWYLRSNFSTITFKVRGEPVDLAGARQLASEDRYQFQWWALSLIGARPYGDEERKGADTGIDGYCYFMNSRDEVKSAIVQVKSGGVSVKDIRDLGHVVEREKAEIGIFLTLELPTGPMQREAIVKGYYHSPLGQDYERLQILTIEECLNGRKPQLPPWVSPLPIPTKRGAREQAKQLKQDIP